MFTYKCASEHNKIRQKFILTDFLILPLAGAGPKAFVFTV